MVSLSIIRTNIGKCCVFWPARTSMNDPNWLTKFKYAVASAPGCKFMELFRTGSCLSKCKVTKVFIFWFLGSSLYLWSKIVFAGIEFEAIDANLLLQPHQSPSIPFGCIALCEINMSRFAIPPFGIRIVFMIGDEVSAHKSISQPFSSFLESNFAFLPLFFRNWIPWFAVFIDERMHP